MHRGRCALATDSAPQDEQARMLRQSKLAASANSYRSLSAAHCRIATSPSRDLVSEHNYV